MAVGVERLTQTEADLIQELKMRGVTVAELYRFGIKYAEVKSVSEGGEVRVLVANKGIVRIPITKNN